jgi:alkylated DNA repair dioxygenase AlkB
MTMQTALFDKDVDGSACTHEHGMFIVSGSRDVVYFRNFLTAAEADHYFSELRSGIEWTQEEIQMYGKRHAVPRLTAWYGDPGATYMYSGIRNEPHRWTVPLLELQGMLEDATGVSYNSVLLNRYRDGQDGLSWHADDEPELGDSPVIASISLGAARDFALRRSGETRQLIKVPLEHGSLLIMKGTSQRDYQHAVPKDHRASEERINLTFRVVGEGISKKKPLRGSAR